mmetsp:Transcript_20325/g.23203  ORF Transcript_20325/g.23203 Transcript_20325/m.23203 type:complete len:529 (+) Transcript_20325:122-1708(+)|eukprot:CAMPEP_0194148980 /NCGR_PEP_ID=MMETSP0152-20130528/35744_1 /TAXON_ID=1049557 /ORGANISM="Thalassiothrix antarctica, Strain L6-D1" /LENGTH=528 /DNA_ID=CAMNT_0038850891 /DNA_START=106 /DNA_END=1695 /DNA_ORIENTATION=+
MSSTTTSRKKRFGPDDFGYSFVGYAPPPQQQEDETAAAGEKKEEGKDESGGVEVTGDSAAAETALKTSAATSVEDKFIYRPPKRNQLVAQASDESAMGKIMTGAIFGLSAGCCCIFTVLLLVGGIYIAADRIKDDAGLRAGVIIIIIATVACICGCCTLCLACCSSMTGAMDDVGGSPSSSSDDSYPKEVKLRLRRLNDQYDSGKNLLNGTAKNVIGKIKDVQKAKKDRDKKAKEEQKKHDDELEKHVQKDIEQGIPLKQISRKYRPVAFYINFDGDISLGKTMSIFRKQVSLVVSQAQPGLDQVVVVVTSPGGMVSAYGLAASQLARIRKAKIHLVVCVDTVAASGGFMMASVADKICAAPFAIVGSIGVVTQIPNFQRFLNKHSIDAYLFTAGKYKRTVDMIGEVTEEGKAKLEEELTDIHDAFKDHIALARPELNDKIEDVATGEAWLAVQAKEKGLVDVIMTSDEYLDSIKDEYEIIEIVEKKTKSRWPPDFNSAVHSVKSAVEDLKQSSMMHQNPQHNAMVLS